MPVILYIPLTPSLPFYCHLSPVAGAVCRSNHKSLFVTRLPMWMSDFQKLFLLTLPHSAFVYFFSVAYRSIIFPLLTGISAAVQL